MTNKWEIQVNDGNNIIFHEVVNGDGNANSHFIIKQSQILSKLVSNDQVIQANPLSVEAKGLSARVPKGQMVHVIKAA
jgi:hypothetical protein